MIKHLLPLTLLLSICSPLALAHFAAQKDRPEESAEFIRVLSAQPIYDTLEYHFSNIGCAAEPRAPEAVVSCGPFTNRAGRAEEVVAYRVHYRYHGHDYITEMPYDPGSRLPVDFDVQPIRW